MAKKSKSKSSVKLPKQVAGVKVPKGLRKQAETLIGFIGSPAGRELAAAGLTLAATALTAKSTDSKVKGADKAAARTMVGKARSAESDAADLGAVLSAAVAEGARRFLQGFEEGKAGAEDKADDRRLQRAVESNARKSREAKEG